MEEAPTDIVEPSGSAPVLAEPPRLRVRHALARFGAPRVHPPAVLDPLLTIVKEHNPKADIALIERAFRTADHYHKDQTRHSGAAYITHPLAVATILAELGMTEATISAALLHDTVEDTSYTMDQLTADFGVEIAEMVDGVTKLDKVKYGENAKAETIRKLVMAMSKDIRVLVIKLADRLHNLRTIHFLRQDKQNRIAKDTLEIFAPLAHRLGMNALKGELEDLSFATLEPKLYDEIVRLVAAEAPRRDEFLQGVIAQVKTDLEKVKIKATVVGRPKHYYSIYQKMIVRGREFAEIYDLVALRILVDTQKDCYAALGVMHERWSPLPGRIKDYIAMPKFNLYQSLHTTVLGPGGKPVEFQIRTHEMHRRAEYGVAAHWKYKEGKDDTLEDFNWVKQITQWGQETEDPGEFLDSLRFEINRSEVYVFTPQGDIHGLVQGATPVDFAYAVHTEVGNKCIGARVNGRLVPLQSTLSSGDVVEVLTSKSPSAGPSRDWLHFVKSPRARAKIRHHFTRERRDESIESGKEQFGKQLRRSGVSAHKQVTHSVLTELAVQFRLADVNALYAAIGEGSVSAQAAVQRLISTFGGPEAVAEGSMEDESIFASHQRPASRGRNESGIVVEGDSGVYVKLAKCCTPVFGDEIIGFVTRGDGVSVHRRDCTNAGNLLATPERIVHVSWGTPSAESSYLVAVQVDGLDRSGLLSDVTKVLSDQHLRILSAEMNAARDRMFRVRLTFETADPTHLEHVLASLRRVSGVYDVYRIKQ